MIGFSLDTFKNNLAHVPQALTETPDLAVDIEIILGKPLVARIKDHLYGTPCDVDIQEVARRLPASAYLKRFTFDQLCKIRYGQIFTMERSVEELFEENPEYAIIRKIQNCMWRWGCGSGVWNEVVDAYDGIRQFNIPIENFTTTLDFTTGCNERGYSRESRTFLDGVFAFLVHYKGEHVMTVGFSIMAGRRLLVQQVQLTKRKGNRFLFNLPANRLEFFLQCFAKAFPEHTLCVADGSDIGNISLKSYKHGLRNAIESLKNPWSERARERYTQERKELEASIAHLSVDLPRLAALYQDTGGYTRRKAFTVNNIRHYPLAA